MVEHAARCTAGRQNRTDQLLDRSGQFSDSFGWFGDSFKCLWIFLDRDEINAIKSVKLIKKIKNKFS